MCHGLRLLSQIIVFFSILLLWFLFQQNYCDTSFDKRISFTIMYSLQDKLVLLIVEHSLDVGNGRVSQSICSGKVNCELLFALGM